MKTEKAQKDSKGRKIHITLPESVHQRLRIKCALEDLTIQDYVSLLISEAVQDIAVVENGKALMKEV
jgi:hypothetical protein